MAYDTSHLRQILWPEQKQLYRYWKSKCHEGHLPQRQHILPQEIKGLLAYLSIIEQDTTINSAHYRYRLAGTGFWNIFNCDITNQYIDEPTQAQPLNYWQKAYQQIIDTQRPSIGLIRTQTHENVHWAQYWIRLPLAPKISQNRTKMNLFLGFDKFIHLEGSSKDMPSSEQKIA